MRQTALLHPASKGFAAAVGSFTNPIDFIETDSWQEVSTDQ
jgi:hypothetical protein